MARRSIEQIDTVLRVDRTFWLNAVHEGRWTDAEQALAAIDKALDDRLALTDG